MVVLVALNMEILACNLQKPEFACRKKYQIEVLYGKNPYVNISPLERSIAPRLFFIPFIFSGGLTKSFL
jgi:hypothetical protein